MKVDKEKRASDWPIKPGYIVGHSSDGESPFDVGIEVGLTEASSLYIGEVSAATLAEYEIKVPFAGWWVCIRTATELQPIALTCSGADGDEAGELARRIATAIRVAEVSPSPAFDPPEPLIKPDADLGPEADQDTPSKVLVNLCLRLSKGRTSPETFDEPLRRAVALVDRGL